MGTGSLRPCLETFSETPAWKPFPGNPWEPVPANLAWEPVPGNLAWKPRPGDLAWEALPGNLAWEHVPGRSLARKLLPGNLAWKPPFGNLAREPSLNRSQRTNLTQLGAMVADGFFTELPRVLGSIPSST